MNFLFLLSGDALELARQEILSLISLKQASCYGKLLVGQARSIAAVKRLAYTRKAYKLLFTCSPDNIEKKFSEYPWKSIYSESFSFRLNPWSERERKLAGMIHGKLDNPKVDLKAARTRIELIIQDGVAYCGLIYWENFEAFMARRPHFRPGFMPHSMHPKLARAMVNLTGSKTSVLDPFCGTGGLLIEAGLMGLAPEGSDMDEKELRFAKKNMKCFSLKCTLVKRDACLMPKADYVATDLPYGRSSKVISKSREELYKSFFARLKNTLGRRAVITGPSDAGCEQLLKKAGLKVQHAFDIYVHKSLTRRILVVE